MSLIVSKTAPGISSPLSHDGNPDPILAHLVQLVSHLAETKVLIL